MAMKTIRLVLSVLRVVFIVPDYESQVIKAARQSNQAAMSRRLYRPCGLRD
jgi:hypothetical protein